MEEMDVDSIPDQPEKIANSPAGSKLVEKLTHLEEHMRCQGEPATMALITDLPEEVIVMIVRRLDFSSLCSMYNACKFFRNILSLHGVILECNMSLNTVATVNTMKLNFFNAISNHLIELNMRGVPDLTKTKVLPAFMKLKLLKVLDISYTNLNILDLMAIHSACPTLKDITVDFKFDQVAVQIAERTLKQCQSLFEHFENVHFVGTSSNLLHSTVVFRILKKSKLDTLKFSVVELDTVHTFNRTTNTVCEIPHFSHFAVYWLTNWKSQLSIFESISSFPVISKIQFNNYKFCIIYTLTINSLFPSVPSVCASPLFKKFFSDHFNVNIQSYTDYKKDCKGNFALMLWNRETTQFDDIFFQKLYSRVKPCFPFYYEALSGVSCPQKFDWIYTKPIPIEVTNPSDQVFDNKTNEIDQSKRRIASMPNVILDYDNFLKDKLKAQLTLVFLQSQTVSASLPCNGQYFSKITFLSLGGHHVIFNTDFFLHLFERCHNLVTLSVEVEISGIAECRTSYDILHAIKASRSMKNLRIIDIDKGMDFQQTFDLLSKCITLENINLVALEKLGFCPIVDPTLFLASCPKLYSVFIGQGQFYGTNIPKQLKSFNKVKNSLKRPHLRVVIKELADESYDLHGYNPFLDVFKLNSIKPI